MIVEGFSARRLLGFLLGYSLDEGERGGFNYIGVSPSKGQITPKATYT